jgi:hypothetical protein
VLSAIILLAASVVSAHAVDEIQVYNAEIAKVGQWTLQMHMNYAFNGRKEPDFPGGLIPHRALNGTPEWAYGITDWWELGFYAPYAVNENGQFLSDGVKIRQLFVTPNASKREFFYGVNFEFSYSTPRFSESRFNSEIRPIVGWHKGDYEFIVNPIVEIGFGRNGEIEFAPAARFARNFGEDLALALEYYSSLGPFRNFLPFNEQQHNIFAVIDFKIGRFDIDFGVGYGLTSGSDRLITKIIVGTELNDGTIEKASNKLKSVRMMTQ